MGSITIKIATASPVTTQERTFTVSDGDIGRIIAWAKATFRGIEGAEPTPEEAVQRWTEWMMNMAGDHLRAHERQNAAVPPFKAV